ncbi:MAG: DinB family protein [Candidatus Heimdallarchaeota archaeon]
MATILEEALRGKYAHVEPLQALEGLSAELASHKLSVEIPSCWEILYHMEYWQELILASLREEIVEWPEHATEGWSTTVNNGDESDWNHLVEHFSNGLKEAEKLSQERELMRSLQGWRNISAAEALQILTIHNSYHLGQLVLLRKQLSSWPPPGGGNTW